MLITGQRKRFVANAHATLRHKRTEHASVQFGNMKKWGNTLSFEKPSNIYSAAVRMDYSNSSDWTRIIPTGAVEPGKRSGQHVSTRVQDAIKAGEGVDLTANAEVRLRTDGSKSCAVPSGHIRGRLSAGSLKLTTHNK